MRRTVFALSLSFALHLILFLFLYDWNVKDEYASTQSKPISLRISTVVAQKEEPKNNLIPSEEVMTSEPAFHVPREVALLKKVPKKETASKPTFVHTTLENNVSSPQLDAPAPHASIVKVSTIQTDTLSYLDAHKNEIIQALQKAKEYPERARKRSIEGVVEVSFTLKPTGEVEGVNAVSKSTILSAAAIECVHKAKAHFPLPFENITIKIPIIYVLK